MVIDKDGNIDFQEWTVPTSWKDITLDMFSDIERYYGDKDKNFDIREVLHILTGKSADEVNALPAEFLEEILGKLTFLNERPEVGEPRNYVIINGEKYVVNTFEKMKTGEYVSFDMALKADKHDYSSFLAILCRKEGEKYDSHYEAELFEQRKNMFGKVPVTDVMPIISFFLTLWFVRETHSQLFSKVEEAVNLIQQNIESSDKIGVFKRRSLNLRMKKLRKLLESNRNI